VIVLDRCIGFRELLANLQGLLRAAIATAPRDALAEGSRFGLREVRHFKILSGGATRVTKRIMMYETLLAMHRQASQSPGISARREGARTYSDARAVEVEALWRKKDEHTLHRARLSC